eukprot:5667761-Prymnesium_polylepis.1
MTCRHSNQRRDTGADRSARYRTWTAHGDYLSVHASTRTSCQSRHRKARVAPVTATRRIIGHRPAP